jgi:formate hydrogenlyase subunit 6/NADH:ubiquinone oxidoreductase subunit I
MGAVRKIKVDTNACIGCQACTHICPADLISFRDDDKERTLNFPQTCAEDCTRCADACSEKAITLVTMEQPVDGLFAAKFPLKRCAHCGTSYATEPMVKKLTASIPALLVSGVQDWLTTCLECRRVTEAKQLAGRGLISRSF